MASDRVQDSDQPENLSNEELDLMANFAPCFDEAVMEAIEENASSVAITQNRRFMLAMLTCDADKTSNFSVSSPEAFGDFRDCIEAYRDHVKQMLAISETACARLAIADCRPAQSEMCS